MANLKTHEGRMAELENLLTNSSSDGDRMNIIEIAARMDRDNEYLLRDAQVRTAQNTALGG